MKKVLIVIVIILIGIQYFTIDKTNPPADMKKDFITLTNPSGKIGNMIKSSCYDCHSHHTKYPWYSNVAPVSWLLKSHIDDARKHVNFSTWGDYNSKKQDHNLEECIEYVKNGEMPMKGYVMLHEEAEITHEQKMLLISWFTELRDSL
jgi:Haem-binding domain